MKLATKLLFAAPVVLLMVGTGVPAAKAWDGGLSGFQSWGRGGGFYAGEQDAIYDHDNGQSYNPIGQCLPCHSDFYWSNFHEGYDHQWNSYQQQDNSQGSSINIYGNNNYVSTNQCSNQQQNPLQQLAHLACGFINCHGPQPELYQQQGYDP